MASVFIKVPVSERLPKEEGVYITDSGLMTFSKKFDWINQYNYTSKAPIWWMQEIELPTHKEMDNLKPLPDDSVVSVYDNGFYNGANFILDKLKGGGVNHDTLNIHILYF